MPRALAQQQDIGEILRLFRESEGAEVFEDPEFEEDLRVVIRVTLQSALAIERLGDDPATACSLDSSIHFDVDMLRDDLRAAMSLDSYQAVESIVTGSGYVE